MTDIMAQQAFGLTAPSSRQDIISALLNEYGTSFGREEASSSAYSPVPALKELPPPPPPPRQDENRGKPLPAFQRMNMKFQLRVDEETSSSPHSPRSPIAPLKHRKRIVSRSLSRESKPPSLKLTISNGTTATIPPTPVLPAQAVPSSQSPCDKELPPPPPPARSEKRNLRQDTMGNQHSKSAEKDLARSDSLLSAGKTKTVSEESPKPVEASPTVKRKALPAAAIRKFKSLAELGQGPRGGKAGPLPHATASSKVKIDGQIEAAKSSKVTMGSQSGDSKSDVTVTPDTIQQQEKAPVNNQLPPTPDEDQQLDAPVPPPKALIATGLPSNPLVKGPVSPLHLRGKSSTGFNLLQAHKAAPSLTPEMTPSPRLKPIQPGNQRPISPLSLLPGQEDQPLGTSTSTSSSKTAVSTAAAAAANAAQKPLPKLHDPNSPNFVPFTPLTRHPQPLPPSLIPPITSAHRSCYTAHAKHIWSNNAYQPLGCMVCRSNTPDRKWCCTWCQLRVCFACSEELAKIPGRDLGILIARRSQVQGQGLRHLLSEDEQEELGDVVGVGFDGRFKG